MPILGTHGHLAVRVLLKANHTCSAGGDLGGPATLATIVERLAVALSQLGIAS